MKAIHDAMHNMMRQIQSMKPTGDADYDFALMMKHHHQGAINIPRAERFIENHPKEIQDLQNWLTNYN